MTGMKKREFEMTQEDLDILIEAGRPVSMIALNAGPIRSPQENVNEAWERLGKKMGFDYLTVELIPFKSSRFFKAKPTR